MGCAPSSDVGVIEFKPDQGQKGIKSKPSYGQDIHSSKVSPLEESNNNSVKKDDSSKSIFHWSRDFATASGFFKDIYFLLKIIAFLFMW